MRTTCDLWCIFSHRLNLYCASELTLIQPSSIRNDPSNTHHHTYIMAVDLHSLPAGSRPDKAIRNNGLDDLAMERYKLRELAEGWPCYR